MPSLQQTAWHTGIRAAQSTKTSGLASSSGVSSRGTKPLAELGGPNVGCQHAVRGRDRKQVGKGFVALGALPFCDRHVAEDTTCRSQRAQAIGQKSGDRRLGTVAR